MSELSLADLEGGTRFPDLVLGTVAPVGTPWNEAFEPYLIGGLKAWGYTNVETIRVSALLKNVSYLSVPHPSDHPERERVTTLMDRGNEFRQRTERREALALLVAAEIRARRAANGNKHTGQAFVVHQFKTPEEVSWLRSIYGDAFHLLALYSSHADRLRYLMGKGQMTEEEAQGLIDRDEGEANPHGQHVRATFHLADFFIEASAGGSARIQEQVDRFLDLLFGKAIISPTKNEYGMYLAHAAALRSTDLSRQVGAAILTDDGDVVALGSNEVPAAGGGQYWGETGTPDYRDFKRGCDYNEVKRREIALEILDKLGQARALKGENAEGTERERDQLLKILESTPLAHLIEFGRAVHAEMEALLSAARRGLPTRNAKLYTTVFPCHNCAKHIVAAGIDQVFYVEPYPKSLAHDMHSDAIWSTDFGEPPRDVSAETATATPRKWVRFSPFIGVAPRRYAGFFARRKMKVEGGGVSQTPLGLRVRGPSLSLGERESLAGAAGEAMKSRARE